MNCWLVPKLQNFDTVAAESAEVVTKGSRYQIKEDVVEIFLKYVYIMSSIDYPAVFEFEKKNIFSLQPNTHIYSTNLINKVNVNNMLQVL